MKPRDLIAAAVLIAALAAPAAAEEVPLNTLYRSIAEKNYYPAVEGLKTATADVTCSVFDTVVAAFPDVDKTAINVTFSWSRPTQEVAPEKKFTVEGIPAEQSDLANRAQLIFKGRGQEDMVIEQPIYWTIETTEATAMADGGTITVTGEAKNPASQLKGLTVTINESDYKINKMVMDLGGSEASIDMTSTDLGGKWGVGSSILTTPQYKRVMQYEYTQVDGFYLPSKISVDYQGLDGSALEPTYVYEFSNWSVESQPEEPAEEPVEEPAEEEPAGASQSES